LMVLTSHAQLAETGKPTGFWLEELAAPYMAFADAGVEITLASPAGGKPPVDPGSATSKAESVARFLGDQVAMGKLEKTLKLSEVDPSYDAVFVVGGHGVMWDLAQNASLAKLLASTADAGNVVAAVCHGPAALVPVTLGSGRSIVDGKRVTGFSNEEEDAVGLTDVVPFALESKLVELGGKYERKGKWESFAVRDGLLVTGQNPASSEAVAKAVLGVLKER
ncbi:MAG: type 1 glutamine amidotransferase domain-containing protein, partial [Myxococcales bacterium]|nr:type 1 glutamine amidotransferase domain-containing protein [Myxococcales bacterium]